MKRRNCKNETVHLEEEGGGEEYYAHRPRPEQLHGTRVGELAILVKVLKCASGELEGN